MYPILHRLWKVVLAGSIGFAALTAAAVLTQPLARAQYVSSGNVIFSVPGQGSNGPNVTQQQQITNTWGNTVWVVAIQIWNGLDNNTQADVIEQVYRVSDGMLLINGNHDDYANGAGGIRIQKQSWNGYLFQWNVGDSLKFIYGCNNFQGGHCAWNVTVWTVNPIVN